MEITKFIPLTEQQVVELRGRTGRTFAAEEWHIHSNGGGFLQNTATVDESVFVDKRVVIFDNARIFDNAQIFGDARICGGIVSGGKWIRQPLCVLGSQYSVTNSAPGMISVGCQTHKFSWWEKHGVKLGKSEGWNEEQVEEYALLIKFVIEHGVKSRAVEVTPDATNL